MRLLSLSKVTALMLALLASAVADDAHYVIQQLRAVIEQQEQALQSQQRILEILKPFVANSSNAVAGPSGSASQPKVHNVNERFMENGPERLFYIENLFSAADIRVLLDDAEENFDRSSTIGAEEDGGVQIRENKPVRRSDTAYVREDGASREILDAIQRMHDLARMPLEYGEELQITKYSPGDYYQFHWDSHFSVGRTATVLVFLNTVKNGGHTVFPGARWHQDAATRQLVEGVMKGSLPPPSSALWSTAGLPPLGETHEMLQPDMAQFCDHPGVVRIPPIAGNALLWFNHDAELDLDWGTLHGGCPPKAGETKLIAQRWMRWYKGNENNFYSIMKECGVIED